MKIQARVVQDELSKRWKWQGVGCEVWPEQNVFFFSVVSFETESEADDDMNEHFRADQDVTQRLVRTKGEISKLVSAAAQTCSACASNEYAEIYWHSPDRSGCNWDLNYARGEMGSACVEQVGPTIGRIRESYNIPNEG